MHAGKKLSVAAIVITVLLGAILATDPRFIAPSELLRNPLLVVFIYAPTIFFATVSMIKWRNGQIWPVAAFAIGLICTGLVHQGVAGAAYGNPGYMVATGHIAAPVVSLVAYLVAFLGSWAVARVTHSLQRKNSHDGKEENRKELQEP